MLAQEQSGCLVFNRLSFLLLETSPSSGSLCPASMHWHHPNGLAGVGYIHWKRACQASSASSISLQNGLNFAVKRMWTPLTLKTQEA
ncbi:hypothetical protein ACRRTK_006353 [Alexandromys fortis]